MIALVFDYETPPITSETQFPKPVCGSFAVVKDGAIVQSGVVLPAELDAWILYAAQQGWHIVGAETSFDLFVNVYDAADPFDRFGLWVALCEQDRVWDVCLVQKLLDGAVDRQHRLFKHGLGPLAKHWLGVDMVKGDDGPRTRFGELIGVPIAQYPKEFYDYSLQDAVNTALVWIEQMRSAYSWYVNPIHGIRYREIFPSRDILADQFRQVRKAVGIKDIAAAGMFTSERSVNAYERTLCEDRDALLPGLISAGLIRREITLNAEAVAARFASHGISVPRLASGRPSITTQLYALAPLTDRALHATRRAKIPGCWPDSAELLARYALELVDVKHIKCEAKVRERVEWAYTQPACKDEKPSWNTDDVTGRHTTIKIDADNCERSGDPVLQAYAEYTSITNTLGGAVELARKATHEGWHVHYNTLRDNGRTATGSDGGQGDGGNAQNMKRECGQREMYIPLPSASACQFTRLFQYQFGSYTDEWLIADSDYVAAELSGFGQCALWYVGFSECARMIREGVDQHSVFGAALIGLPDPTGAGWKELKKRKKAGDQKADEARTGGKGMSFGCKARMSAKRYLGYAWTNYGLKLDGVADAQRCIDIHNSIIREMDPYTTVVTSTARDPWERKPKHDLVHPLTGRCRAGLSYPDVHNYPFSGLAQDWAGHAAWELCKAKWGHSKLGRQDPFFGCQPFLFVHDSFSAYVPAAGPRATAAADRLGEIMRDAAAMYLPDVGCDTDPNVLRQLSKKAGDAVRVDGVIVPFCAWEQCAREFTAAAKAGKDPVKTVADNGWARYIIQDVMAGHTTMPK